MCIQPKPTIGQFGLIEKVNTDLYCGFFVYKLTILNINLLYVLNVSWRAAGEKLTKWYTNSSQDATDTWTRQSICYKSLHQTFNELQTLEPDCQGAAGTWARLSTYCKPLYQTIKVLQTLALGRSIQSKYLYRTV